MEFQIAKEAKSKTDLKSAVAKEYHTLLDVFSKRDSDIFSPHQKYDHKIILEEKQKYGHVFLHKISLEEIDIVKHYLNTHLIKGFILVCLASYLSPVHFIRKLGGGIRFYIDY